MTSIPDRLTVVGIALFAYALANILHEGVGHGGACLLFGGSPEVLSSVHFECAAGSAAMRGIAAAGTIVNLFVGAIALLALNSIAPRENPHAWYFVWLFATLNLLMGAGYFLFSGAGNIGDWAVVAGDSLPAALWRPAMAVFGAALYFWLARCSARALRMLTGGDELRNVRGRRLAIPAYLAGGVLYCVSGLLNPVGPLLVAISAAAASFGGASGLLWLTALLRHFDGPAEPVALKRSNGWIVAGAIAAVVFIAVLGPAIEFDN